MMVALLIFNSNKMEIIEAEYFSDHKLFNNAYNYNKESEVYNILLTNLDEKKQ